MVNIKTIDAKVLSRMFLAGAKNLEAKKEWINELNVFPVPDGDTGTNMTMTIMSAAAEVSALTEPDMETLAKAISSGSLRGARGNSGVILSQLLRGFTRGVRKSNELDAITIAAAMERAVETAYKAVMKPKEGTILTVAKEASLKAAEIAPEAEELESTTAKEFIDFLITVTVIYIQHRLQLQTVAIVPFQLRLKIQLPGFRATNHFGFHHTYRPRQVCAYTLRKHTQRRKQQ